MVIACFFIAVSPASAGTKYMAGSPDLSAYIDGTNELSPGDTVSLNVVIENKGVNQFKFVQSGIMDRDDLPNTAKFLTVALDSGDAPLTVKSDPQMLGDLKGSTTATAVFNIKVRADAPAGTYNLPLTLDYTYMYEADQYGFDTIEYLYKVKTETVSLPITIKPEVKLAVESTETTQLNVGTEGYINITVKNIGHESGKKAVLKISRNGNSPIIPTQSSVYIGDFPEGATVTTQFKASVSSDAQAQTYPLDILVNYENYEGDQVNSDTETIGIPVGRKIDFAVISAPAEVSPGQKKVIKVTFKNIGGATVYNAQARISAVDPFTSNDDTAFLGTLAPGETGEAAYEISVDSTATLKEYGLDSEIQYRDALDNSLISDTLKIRVNVVKNTGGIAGILSNPLALGIIAVGIIIIGILVYLRKKKNM